MTETVGASQKHAQPGRPASSWWTPGYSPDKTADSRETLVSRHRQSGGKGCLACQAATHTNTPKLAPIPSEVPPGPWQHLAVDFLGPLPSGHYIMSVVDECSKYPEIKTLKSTEGWLVCDSLEKIFSVDGIPAIVTTDNGPPFNGKQFSKFATYMGFKHRKITPYWPRANGMVERFNQPLMKAIRATHIEQSNWKHVIYVFLRNYRSTAHASTGKSPGELLFNRPLQTTLPADKPPSQLHTGNQRDRGAHIKIGDKVLVKQTRQNKLIPAYA